MHEHRNGVEKSVKLTDMIPRELTAGIDKTEMKTSLVNGSIHQIMGADSDESVERLRGANPIGVVLSEYAHGTKMEAAWDTLRPVLAENGGWALFIYTPNGPNHGEKLALAARANPENWYFSELTVQDTRRDAPGEDGSPVVTLETIEQERRDGAREEFIQQEYYCAFTGFQHGTIYGDLMLRAVEDGRILRLPYVVNHPVGVCLDLGHSDAMAAWFYQRFNNAVNFIDYWEDTQKDMRDFVRVAREGKPYIYGRVVLPWDGRGAADYLHAMHFRNVHVCDRTASVQASIESVRREFSRFYFDEVRCQRGIDHLRNYKREWDDEKRVFSGKPLHDEHSHGADALRTGVEGGFDPLIMAPGWGSSEVKVITEFDPRMPMI